MIFATLCSLSPKHPHITIKHSNCKGCKPLVTVFEMAIPAGGKFLSNLKKDKKNGARLLSLPLRDNWKDKIP